MTLPTASAVAERLDYNPLTGEFRWKQSSGNGKCVVGALAGSCSGNNGYWQIGVLGRTHTAQRLAWLLSFGKWPDGEIDHIDGVRLNNRLNNLRDCTHADNMQNRASWSEHAGARPAVGGWRAEIQASNQKYHLGIFSTPAEAHAAYAGAKRVLHRFAPDLRSPVRVDA